MGQSVELEVPADLRFRYCVLSACSCACQLTAPCEEILPVAVALKDPFVAAFLSAISEIFTNLVHYSESDSIKLSIRVDGPLIELTTADSGKPFDPDSLSEPVAEDFPESGMGVFIARQSLDTLEYKPGPPNSWILRKRRTEEPKP